MLFEDDAAKHMVNLAQLLARGSMTMEEVKEKKNAFLRSLTTTKTTKQRPAAASKASCSAEREVAENDEGESSQAENDEDESAEAENDEDESGERGEHDEGETG